MTDLPRRPALDAVLGLRRRRAAVNTDPALADPKSVVTPDALSVTPELLGAPLAAPRRRLAALVLDLVLISFLQALGWRFVLGGAAMMLFLAIVRPSGGAQASPLRKAAAGCGGALVLIVTVVVALLPTVLENRTIVPTPDGTGFTIRTTPPGGDTLAADELGSEATGTRIVFGPGSQDASEPTDARDAVDTLGRQEPSGPRNAAAAFDTAMAVFARLADSAAAAEVQASEEGVGEPTTAGSGDAGSRGTAFDWIRDAADEAGLVFGWGTVYITLFLALWNGRTPGKRLLDLRVVRVTGGRLGLLMSFERAGGYAAGLATGLLGFARVWWDPNRQAIHDKIAETVVIREKLAKASGFGDLESRRDIPAAAAATNQSDEPTKDKDETS